jgi:hypothetical protein
LSPDFGVHNVVNVGCFETTSFHQLAVHYRACNKVAVALIRTVFSTISKRPSCFGVKRGLGMNLKPGSRDEKSWDATDVGSNNDMD